MRRPGRDEYDAFYETYVGKVSERPVIEVLFEAPEALGGLLAGLSAADETFAYAPGKWSIREVLGHVLDTERLFAYRALHFARADSAALPGMDQEVWAAGSHAADRPLGDQLGEFRALREANTVLFASFDEDVLSRRGVASGVEFTVRALVHIVAGHELHHRGVLESRYLAALPHSAS
jgi:uncharacterized damage-inducible protein DinB